MIDTYSNPYNFLPNENPKRPWIVAIAALSIIILSFILWGIHYRNDSKNKLAALQRKVSSQNKEIESARKMINGTQRFF